MWLPQWVLAIAAAGVAAKVALPGGGQHSQQHQQTAQHLAGEEAVQHSGVSNLPLTGLLLQHDWSL